MLLSRRHAVLTGSGALLAAGRGRAAPSAPSSHDDSPPFAPEVFGRLTTPKPLPPLMLQNEQGQDVALRQWVGKPFILHFWATWCGPCVQELPLVNATAKALGAVSLGAGRLDDTGPAIVAVGVRGSTASKIRAFYNSHGIDALPLLVDPTSQALFETADIPAALAALQASDPETKTLPPEKNLVVARHAVPRSLVVNAHGDVVALSIGNMTWSVEAVRHTVSALLG